MGFELREYTDLNEDEKKIRQSVFVDEQKFELEFDDTDNKAMHYVMYDGETAIGCCRAYFEDDPRINFTGTVYDQELLKKIRENAYANFHGHEVGGTNPSLLEALGSTDLNLLLNVGFNREVAEDAALYWTKEQGNLSALIHRADRMTESEIRRFGQLAKDRVREHYSWDQIVAEYEALFQERQH